MSDYTLYEASIVMSRDSLGALENILKKAEASSAAERIPTARIHEDMLPFTFQVHAVTNNVQKLVARLSGEKNTVDLDNDFKTIADMLARVALVREKLEGAPSKEAVNARGADVHTIGLGPGRDATMELGQYVHAYILPNNFFHLVTAYDIARKEGVELSKIDYILPFLGRYMG